MKKNFLYNYVSGIQDTSHGEHYSKITKYFIPEFITAVILYSVPLLIDARFVACCSMQAYATLGATNTLLHFVVKVAEGLSVGTIVMTGRFNGVGDFKQAGKVLINSFWTTIFSGLVVSLLLYFGAYSIYVWYNVPSEIITLGVPFLKVRAIGIFFMFVYFAFIGFLRGIKNTKVPMVIFIAGSGLFLFLDYVLIFGYCGFPRLELQGSAIATVVQYAAMCLVAYLYIFFSKDVRKYAISLVLHLTRWSNIKELVTLSLPVMIDKGALSASYLWLGKCIAPMGTCVIASFSAVKDLERFALLPAIAFAQVITFLVSNDCGKKDWQGITNTTKKIAFLSTIMVLIILSVCSLFPEKVIRIFDMRGNFTDFASAAFPIISILAFFDVLQLILAGALRGASNVKTVMWTRVGVCFLFFVPLSYFLSVWQTTNQMLKFVLIYSSLYVGNGLMTIIYIRRLRGSQWKNQAMRNNNENNKR